MILLLIRNQYHRHAIAINFVDDENVFKVKILFKDFCLL